MSLRPNLFTTRTYHTTSGSRVWGGQLIADMPAYMALYRGEYEAAVWGSGL